MMHEVKVKRKKSVNILIIDDHKMVRDGLKLMLDSLKQFMHFNVCEAETGEQAILKIERHEFDIALLDYQLPGISGAETVYRILRFKPEMKILALSSYDELPYIQSMMDAGAKGYVLKDIEPAELLKAIKTILSDNVYYCNTVAIKLIESKEDSNLNQTKVSNILTSREVEILRMIALEMTNEEIAAKLFISKRTIDTHRQHILNKLHAKNTAGLVKAAYRFRLIEN